jgi:hypothetical protein
MMENNFCKLGKDLDELNKIAYNTDNKTIKNFGGKENDYCNSDNHCDDTFYCNKEFNKCFKKGTAKKNDECDSDNVCDSSYYCDETSKKCIRGTGKWTDCTRDGNCDINYNCKTFISSNGFGPDEILSKCILDYKKFCEANNRTYGKLYSDKTYKKIDPKNNPTNIPELYYCDETDAEKLARKTKEDDEINKRKWCIEEKKNDNTPITRNKCQPIYWKDILPNTTTSATYQKCMRENDCGDYDFLYN